MEVQDFFQKREILCRDHEKCQKSGGKFKFKYCPRLESEDGELGRARQLLLHRRLERDGVRALAAATLRHVPGGVDL